MPLLGSGKLRVGFWPEAGHLSFDCKMGDHKWNDGDFPSATVVGTPQFQCKGHEFNLWSGSWDPTLYMDQQRRKKKWHDTYKMFRRTPGTT